jgi:small conductance mechanosensitive channel
VGVTFVPNNLDALAALVWTWAATLLPRLATAIVVIVAGALLAKWVARTVSEAILETGKIDETARPVLASVARYSVLILTFVVALSQLGVQTASLLAALGAAGLAIGLALQGTLSNIAAGIMLLWLRPFRVGDYIEVITGNVVAGTVKEIGLFACLLETFDGLFVFAPNSTIWHFAVRNHSRSAGRLICLNVGLPVGSDPDRAGNILVTLIREHPGVLKQPAPEVFVDSLNAGAPLLTCRLWAARDGVSEIQRTLPDQARRSLEAASADLKPIQVIRTVPSDSDPSRLL